MLNRTSPLVLGIAGGTGSGKTTVSNAIVERVGPHHLALLAHDAYYRDLSNLPITERVKINFDHPNSLETELLIQHIKQLRRGEAVEIPVYDFKTHSRTTHTIHLEPCPIIIVEGILIFTEPELRKLFDIKVFVDTDADIRFIRRLERDINERGRSSASVIHQYLSTVRPMHMEFVEPSRRFADIIVPEGGLNIVALDMIVARIQSLLNDKNQTDPST
jgi:uridine kinase